MKTLKLFKPALPTVLKSPARSFPAILALSLFFSFYQTQVSQAQPSATELRVSIVLTNQQTRRPVVNASVSINIYDKNNRRVGTYQHRTRNDGSAFQRLSIHGRPTKFYGHYALIAINAPGFNPVHNYRVMWSNIDYKPQGNLWVNHRFCPIQLTPQNGAHIRPGQPQHRCQKCNRIHHGHQCNHGHQGHNPNGRANLRQFADNQRIRGITYSIQYNQTSPQQLAALIGQLNNGGMIHRSTMQIKGLAVKSTATYCSDHTAVNAVKWLKNYVPEFRNCSIQYMNDSGLSYEQRMRRERLKIVLP